MPSITRIERVLLLTALTLLSVWGAARLHSVVSSKAAVAQFEAEAKRQASADHNSTSPLESILNAPVDFRLWSPKRVAAYQDSLTQMSDRPLAVLRIPKINLEVPVFNDTSDLTLNRGVGRILGTAQVGEEGNLGIAGHRDGFFRGLQSISQGDSIELVAPARSDRYVVSEIRIVTPDDVSVLHPTAVPTITLVTCFPFYFVGHAPKRYIVIATLAGTSNPEIGADKGTSFPGQEPHKEGEKR
jgi:sortase A